MLLSDSQSLPVMSEPELLRCHLAFERRCMAASAARHACGFGLITDQVTYFHSSRVPDYSLSQIGLFVHGATLDDFGVTHDIVAAALVLANRYADVVPVLSDMMHRLYIAALFVSLKINCDFAPRVDDFARLTGVAAWELPRMESSLLLAIDYHAVVFDYDIDALLTDSS